MRFILAVFAVACLADGLNDGCVGDECSVQDDSVLVQKRRAPTTTTGKGLALEGGGFLAHATHAGVLTALMNQMTPKPDFDQTWGLKPGLEQEEATSNRTHGMKDRLPGLMKNIDVISSISGGSWFMSQLAYSEHFVGMIEQMAEKPESAGDVYKELFIDPFLKAIEYSPKDGETFDADIMALLRSETPPPEDAKRNETPATYVNNDRVVGDSPSQNYGEIFAEIVLLEKAFTEHGGPDWQQLVALLLTSTTKGDMTESQTLGSKVNPWAKGKWWLVGAAVSTTGGSSGPATCSTELETCRLRANKISTDQTIIYENPTTSKENAWAYSLKRQPESANAVATWTPARFSTVLGAGAAEDAPMKFVEKDFDNLQFTYKANGKSSLSQQGGNGNYAAFAKSDTPLFGAVSASSAFMGFTAALRATSWKGSLWLLNKYLEWLKPAWLDKGLVPKAEHCVANMLKASTKLAVWIESAAKGGKLAFTQASSTLKTIKDANGQPPNLALEAVAQNRLTALVDGGLADNTGIGNALAAKRDEIICFEPSLDHVWQLMGGEKGYTNIIPHAMMKTLGWLSVLPSLKWLAPGNQCPMCYANFQLFKETSAAAKQQWKEVMTKLVIPNGVKNMNALSIGTLKVTTQDNDYFGIEADRTVTLHIVNVDTSMGIGGYNYYDYPTLVQDIVTVLLDPVNQNKGSTGEVISWFL